MPNFDVRDAYGSVITIESSVVGGANRQVISATLGNSSVVLLNGANVIGSVAVLQGTTPWIISSVYGNIAGSVLSQQLGTRISSIISSTPSSLLTGASIFGQLPAGEAVLGSIATLQGTNPWRTLGSVSGTVDIGTIPGSTLAYQGTAIWNISSVYGNISGSVLSQQLGTRISSIVNSIPSSLLTGAYGHRNDAVASFLGGNLTWNPIATDSAGRVLSRPFAPEASRIEGYASTVNLNANSIIAAAGAGLRNYITDVWVANTGAANTLVTFLSGGGLSVLGYTIAPATGGSNLLGLVTPMRTDIAATFDFRAATGTSVLYITAKGFTAP